ncbi:MAG: STAS domain-containing protein, partial [Candidatus Omnitrophica bacterium]|nr:STAS domain-containing protein [Candidatus Omnitrophota bacterium]
MLVALIDGELNASNAPQLAREFDKLDTDSVVLDMAKIGYVDSMGLAALVAIVRQRELKQRVTIITGVNPKVRDIPNTMQAGRIFTLMDD